MQFRFWGTRGSIPTPGPDTVKYGGNTSCVEVNAGGRLIIMDAGTGMRLLGLDLLGRPGHPKEFDILISHTHWDHIQGFPYFAPAFIKGYKLRIYGCQGTGNRIEKVLSQQMDDDYFPLSFMELSADIKFTDIMKGPFAIGDAKVDFTFLNHPGLALGYSIECDGRKLVYCPDMEPFRHNVLSDDTEVNLSIEDYVANLDGKVVEFVRGADCLLVDGTFTEEEYASKPGWGHSSYLDSVRLAVEAGVGKVYLIHQDPSHTDEFLDGMIRKAKAHARKLGGKLECRGGREGETVRL